jgi:calcineurin-like phosphoesterase family protein
MPETFLASDTHLGHRLMERTRPWDMLEEHDEAIIDNWNKVVGPKDLVYHLGDVVMNRNKLHLAGRLNGRKKLIFGNHDVHPIEMYLEHFESVASYKVFEWAILSHIPVHESQLTRFKFNIHGHLHGHQVMFDDDFNMPDPRYFCVAMENIDYKPISLDVVRERLGAVRQEKSA